MANAASTISRTNAVIPTSGYITTAATMGATSKIITIPDTETFNTCRVLSAPRYLPTLLRRRSNLSSYRIPLTFGRAMHGAWATGRGRAARPTSCVAMMIAVFRARFSAPLA